MEMNNACKILPLLAVNQTPAARVTVRRGPQLMVIFASKPHATDIQSLKLAGVKIGLVLASNDLSKISSLDDYSYVFSGVCCRGKSLLKQAISDLAQNGWTIDDDGISDANLVEPRAPRAPVRTLELYMAQA